MTKIDRLQIKWSFARAALEGFISYGTYEIEYCVKRSKRVGELMMEAYAEEIAEAEEESENLSAANFAQVQRLLGATDNS